MKIEKIHIKNYKVFKDAEINKLGNMCVFLGANGSGKSTLFDVFAFLGDALRNNIKTAIQSRGGFKEVISRDQSGDIEFEIKFRNDHEKGVKQPLITYLLKIGLNEKNQIIVKQETLSYRRGQTGKPWKFLDFANGQGKAIKNEDEYGKDGAKPDDREEQVLDSPDILAIKGLGQFQKFKAVSAFRSLLENWYIANFQIPDAKKNQDIGVYEHLSASGDNLANVADYMYENNPEIFQTVLEKMSQRVPGISKVQAAKFDDGRILLKFQDGSFKDPFMSRFVSDGTLKMFAYLILLNEHKIRPLLCIEEPENYLHPYLLRELAEEFREYALKGGQVFISSHSPDFVNALKTDELFWMSKENGVSIIQRAADNEIINNLCEEGDKLGYLWNQGYFKGSSPEC